jgi:hypothetical protein
MISVCESEQRLKLEDLVKAIAALSGVLAGQLHHSGIIDGLGVDLRHVALRDSDGNFALAWLK